MGTNRTRKAVWSSLEDVRKVYPKADGVTIGKLTYTIFNVLGNQFRLVVQINYDYQKIFFKRLMTHAEYDQPEWKESLKQEQRELRIYEQRH